MCIKDFQDLHTETSQEAVSLNPSPTRLRGGIQCWGGGAVRRKKMREKLEVQKKEQTQRIQWDVSFSPPVPCVLKGTIVSFESQETEITVRLCFVCLGWHQTVQQVKLRVLLCLYHPHNPAFLFCNGIDHPVDPLGPSVILSPIGWTVYSKEHTPSISLKSFLF